MTTGDIHYTDHGHGEGGGEHPDLAEHDALGLATDDELSTHEGNASAHGSFAASGHNHDADYVNEGDHTKAAHDSLGLSHDSLSDVSANDHHNQSHTQTDHTGTGSTSTQAFGDSATAGTGTMPANIDHKHAMPADPVPSHASNADAHHNRSHDHSNASDSTTLAPVTLGVSGNTTLAGRVLLTSEATNTDTGTIADPDIGDLAVWKWNGASAATLASLGSTAGQAVTGRVLTVMNVSSTESLTLAHASASGTNTRRLFMPSDTNVVLGPRNSVTLIYGSDGTNSRWRTVAGPPLHNNLSGLTTGDPHTQYRLESEDHTHASTGLQGGTVAYTDLTSRTHGASDHSTRTRSIWVPASAGELDSSNSPSNGQAGTSPDRYAYIQYADSATSYALFTVVVPHDWSSGAVNIKCYFVGGAAFDGSAAFRWERTYAQFPTDGSGSNLVSAGTTAANNLTPSASYGAQEVYIDSARTLGTPAAAGDVIRITLGRLGGAGGDTYTGVVRLLGFLIEYTADM